MPTSKQEKFAQAIVDGANQSDAYRLVYDTENMLPNTIHHEAYLLAGDHYVAARITELRQSLQDASFVTNTAILAELKQIGFANLSDLVSWSKDGISMNDSDDLPRSLSGLVSEVSETRNKDGGVSGTKIKLHSKLDALDKMAKIIGMYADAPTHQTDVKITKVTIILDHGDRKPETSTKVLDAESKIVDDDDE